MNYIKGRDDPVALEDEEYPEWLWKCLEVKKKEGDDAGGAGDEFCTCFTLFYLFLGQKVSSMVVEVRLFLTRFHSEIQETPSSSSEKAKEA